MAYRWQDGVIYAPDGFLILARTGDALNAFHVESRKVARVSGVAIKVDSRAESVQRELDRACAKLLLEIEREKA
jgi:cobalamin biosynthesis protein CbiG